MSAPASASAHIAELAAKLEQAGAGWHAPLLRAAMADALAVCFVMPGGRVPLWVLDPVKHPKPLVLILSGDDVEAAQAAEFPQAKRLVQWAARIMVHGAAGAPEHYALAAHAAMSARRLLIIETSSALLPEWVAFCKRHAARTPTLAVAVPGGGQHPCETRPAEVVLQ
ncbi:hypothetical protein [Falsiroseomonas bella]|uniref:hypothetical protein n=1 Tax=Falsiroseomonas bella TaxID=2184016 RepID=UPI0013047CEB|nr:hypothetical protein [Falsiroseomonas bella]